MSAALTLTLFVIGQVALYGWFAEEPSIRGRWTSRQESDSIFYKMSHNNEEEKQRSRGTVNAGLAGVAGDVIDRYGSGVKEHIFSLNGIDNEYFLDPETGNLKPRIGNNVNKSPHSLKRSLSSVAGSKRHGEDSPFYKTETKNQAGFSAEIKEVARRRAEEAIAGKKPTTSRTDDLVLRDENGKVILDENGLPKTHTNDQLFDITTKVDANGNPVPGSSAQMKFVGSSPKEAVGKMLSKDYQKYIDNDVKMMVPSDYYDGIKSELDARISSLEEQIDKLESQGKTDVAEVKKEQLEKCRILKKNLVKSKVSNDEAIEARNNPRLSTAKDIARLANRAGLEQAKMGAAIGGGMSLIRNLVSVCKNEKDAKEAALDVAGDTAQAAALSYATAFSGAIIKGSAQNSSSELVKTLSKTNLPAYIATSTLEVGKTLKSYFSGEIDGVQCLEQLGEKGYGMVNSALYAAIGQVAIPIPVVGALIGSMLGYALGSASYGALTQSLKEAKMAREERIRIEAEVAESISMLREYRAELEAIISKYLKDTRDFFDETFSRMKSSLQTGDIDGYIASTNAIARKMGKRPVYDTFSQFDSMMVSDVPLKF